MKLQGERLHLSRQSFLAECVLRAVPLHNFPDSHTISASHLDGLFSVRY